MIEVHEIRYRENGNVVAKIMNKSRLFAECECSYVGMQSIGADHGVQIFVIRYDRTSLRPHPHFG